MGQEIKCRVEFGKEKSEGKALLETSEVLFRGGFRPGAMIFWPRLRWP